MPMSKKAFMHCIYLLGFRKILKKHDKNLSTDAGARWRSEHVDSAQFYINKDIDKLIQDTENTFISELEDGNRQKAMKRLRVPPLGDKQSPWTTFKVIVITVTHFHLL